MRNTNLCPPSYNNRKRLKRFYRRFFSTPQELTDFVNQVMENDAGLVMANQVQRFVDLSRENQGNYHSRSDFLTISYCRICLESLQHLSKPKAEIIFSNFLRMYGKRMVLIISKITLCGTMILMIFPSRE